MMEFIQMLLDWYMANLNYFTIAILMAIESSFIPFPSEVVIPFAAYKAAEGSLNFWAVILSGTAGALLGAFINYYLAFYLGRPLVYKLADTKAAHFLLINREKVEHAENYFIRNGRASTFIGRLVPAVRQLISLPAGLAKMNLRDFTLFTFAGAGIWNIILAVIGFYLYDIKDQIIPYLGYIFLALGVVFVIWLIWKGRRKKSSEQDVNQPR